MPRDYPVPESHSGLQHGHHAEVGVLSFARDPEDAWCHLVLSPRVLQELFLVCLFFLGYHFKRVEEVGAYKMDFSLLGLLSFAASCSTGEHGLKRGCVYFTFDFFGNTNDFHIFDLKEGTRELTRPDQDVPRARCFGWFLCAR